MGASARPSLVVRGPSYRAQQDECRSAGHSPTLGGIGCPDKDGISTGPREPSCRRRPPREQAGSTERALQSWLRRGKQSLEGVPQWPDALVVRWNFPRIALMYEMRNWQPTPIEAETEAAAV